MTSYILKEVLCNKYNRSDEKRFDRSVVFVIQNTNNRNLALFQLDRIGKNRASLRCNNRSCGHRLSLEHNIPKKYYQNLIRLVESFKMMSKLFNLTEKNL